MNYASKPQIAKIHTLLTKLGLIDDKKSIVMSYSNDRTDSTKELFASEAKRLITVLSEYDPQERMKTLIFSLAYQEGIIYGASGEDKKINAAKLNLFLKERGSVKKELNAMSYPELIKVHRQFEAIVKSVKKSRDNKNAEQAVTHLLTELNISTSQQSERRAKK